MSWASAGTVAFAAAPVSAPTSTQVPQQEAAVLSHLNSNLAWYHEVQRADAWNEQPRDEFYLNTQHDLTNEAVVSAFEYAHAMVVVIGDEGKPAAKAASGDLRKQHLATLEAANTERLVDLKDLESALDDKLSAPQQPDRPTLLAQRRVLQAEIDLDTSIGDSIEKASSLFAGSDDTNGTAGLAAQISALEQAGPAVLLEPKGTSQNKKPAASAPASNQSPGLVNRAIVLFSLIRDRRSLDLLISRTQELEKTANGLADPLSAELRRAVQEGDEMGEATAQTNDPAQLEEQSRKIEALTMRFRSLSAALIPLREEAVALEHSRTNFVEWKRSVVDETNIILRTLFLRAIGLAVALVVLVAISELWRRATFKYVHDARRRRQFQLIRRFATTTLMVLIVVLGFISDFSSLATFAGFITAGIAVALQTVILSVAAYFFLIGRYGVRVGDRVTVSGVTGDVIDIGLVRVFLMELAGTGVDLHPTGRVVVLANSALFSAAPLYKQLPGTDYAWHEVYVTMAGDADTVKVEEVLSKAVDSVYADYRISLERQHGALERLLDYRTDVPVPSTSVRLTDSGLEVVVRYPVEIRRMSQVDEAVTRKVLAAFRSDAELKKSLTATPRIRSAVKA
jgi:small-conductance mechanosensitive channel